MNMKHRYMVRYFLTAILPVGMVIGAFAQAGLLQTLSGQSNNYRSGILQEKVFVHLDKPFYMTGEIIWCKLYCVEGYSHRPLSVSKVAYVELLDGDNKPVFQGKVLLSDGQGSGSFYLTTSINSGTYRLRAYTNWMKNTGTGSFFEEPVTIVNPFRNLPASPVYASPTAAQSTSSVVSITDPSGKKAVHPMTGGSVGFFPEGGNLVNGLQSRIGFEMTDRMGRGVDGNGFLLNEHNDTLVNFRPLQFGLGSFLFTPVAGHVYKAVILFPDGITLTKDLPVALDKGYVMQVSTMDIENTKDMGIKDQLLVKVLAAKGPSSGSDVYLIIKTGTRPDISSKATLRVSRGQGDDSALFVIDKHSLGEGVNQLTLLDPSGQPVCERLYAIPPKKDLAITASTEHTTYGMRQKVQVALATRASGGQGIATSLSMAVYREDSLQSRDGTDIFSYLWLGSDLKGRIESPDYYLSGGGSELANRGSGLTQAWDNLMLTHGWRRFHWDDIRHQLTNPHLIPPEHGGQLITGRILNRHTATPAGGIIVFCSVPRFEISVCLCTHRCRRSVFLRYKRLFRLRKHTDSDQYAERHRIQN